MRNIRFEGVPGAPADPEDQKRRIQQVIREELTDTQRETLLAYYFQDKSIPQIAEERGVNMSTVWRTLTRAERRLRAYLKY